MLAKEATTVSPLESLYRRVCTTPTDINEHLPLLRRMAGACDHVTEFGTRGGNSTTAFLAAQPKRLVCYDLVRYEQVDVLSSVAGITDFTFHQADVLTSDIEETDLLFIDTWHVYEQLRAELRRHSPKVRKWIVLHDTTSYAAKGENHGYRGLWPAVEQFLERGTFIIKTRFTNNNGLTILERVQPESEAKPQPAVEAAKVYLAIPAYQGITGEMLMSLDSALDPHGDDCMVKWYESSSFHCRNYNVLWAAMLNSRFLGWTDFAMIHQDVEPSGFWLSAMLDLKRKHNLDVLSVVLAQKRDLGVTSTAVFDPKTGRLRRLTMKEVMELPETFDAEMAGYPGWQIMVSDGLWVADISKPWVEKVWFETRDRIIRDDKGVFKTETISEDWFFSVALHRLGVKVMATRAIPATHWGRQGFPNDHAWGTWETDRECDGTFGDWPHWEQPGE